MRNTMIRLAAVAAGGTLALAGVAPAWAATDFTLQESHEHTYADEHGEECADERMEDRADDEDGWHFVISGGTFLSLTVTFAPDGDPDNVAGHEVISGSPGDDGPIVFYDAGPDTPHAYVFVPAGWLLVTATASAEGGQQLVVSHTCAGEPGPEPTPTPTTEPTPTPTATTPGTDPEDPEEPEGGLPVTGVQAGLLGIVGAGLLAAGGATLLLVRRRNASKLLEE